MRPHMCCNYRAGRFALISWVRPHICCNFRAGRLVLKESCLSPFFCKAGRLTLMSCVCPHICCNFRSGRLALISCVRPHICCYFSVVGWYEGVVSIPPLYVLSGGLVGWY